ncbi:MAG TPA: plasmid stabilization protein ParE [Brevundimonas sp.]|nr:plasmid stabilization protein ParE [Brevundimonas sp.]HAF81696.1 plasmid stabilization protein ParE [Brevundimonas sp.]
MGRLRLTEDADHDLANIYIQGVQTFGMAQADRYIDDLLQALDRIQDFPNIARLRETITPAVRAYVFRSHVILYDLEDDDGVVVIRIRHAHEDWMNLVQEIDDP